MRFSKLALSLSFVLLLSACNSIVNDKPLFSADTQNWANGHPSTLEQRLWKMPTGYYGQNKRRPMPETGVDSADGSVTVFPVEQPQDVAPAPVTDDANMLPPVADDTAKSADNYGDLAQELYFAHGSSKIGDSDRKSLQALAKGFKHSDKQVDLTIVGHASTRVDGVSDDMQRKLINFKMAQKRADAVTRVLKKSGVQPDRIQAISKGDEEPNPSIPAGKSQEAADRRVDVYTK